MDFSTDEIALVPTGTSRSDEPEEVVPSKENGSPQPLSSFSSIEHTTCKGRKLLAKYRRSPATFFYVLTLGSILLFLILACVGFETWRSARENELAGYHKHSGDERAYHENLVRIINSNPNSTWKAKLNQFATKIVEVPPVNLDELSKILSKNKLISRRQLLQDTEEHLRTLVRKKMRLPSSFDARFKWPQCWSVHQVYNQGGCGSCWSVSATGVMSDRLCIGTNGSLQTQLSAQDLTSCCTLCGGCQGTHWALSSFTFWKDEGLVSGGSFGSTEGCKPYTLPADCGSPCSTAFYHQGRTPTCERTCQPLYDQQYEQDVVRSSKAYWLRAAKGGSTMVTPIVQETISSIVKDSDYSTLLKKEIYLHGPILACFTAYEDFQHYNSGIYQPQTVPNATELYGHCAKLIGWGIENGTEFWTYMNTWGRDWGEHGFFRVVSSEIPEEAVAGLL